MYVCVYKGIKMTQELTFTERLDPVDQGQIGNVMSRIQTFEDHNLMPNCKRKSLSIEIRIGLNESIASQLIIVLVRFLNPIL